jgi:hypothetical protein
MVDLYPPIEPYEPGLLERDGMVKRKMTPSTPRRVEYELTALGRSLSGPIKALSEWAAERRAEIAAARNRWDEAATWAARPETPRTAARQNTASFNKDVDIVCRQDPSTGPPASRVLRVADQFAVVTSFGEEPLRLGFLK